MPSPRSRTRTKLSPFKAHRSPPPSDEGLFAGAPTPARARAGRQAPRRTALPMLDPAALRPCAVAPEDGLDGNAPDRREYVGFEGGQSAQLVRQRQNVLAHRHIGENSVHDGGSRIGHAPPRATRAHGSRLTRERNEEIMTARIAPRACQPLGEDTTLEVGPELGLDVAGEATVVALAGVREKRFEMLAYKTVENGLGRTAGQIGT